MTKSNNGTIMCKIEYYFYDPKTNAIFEIKILFYIENCF